MRNTINNNNTTTGVRKDVDDPIGAANDQIKGGNSEEKRRPPSQLAI